MAGTYLRYIGNVITVAQIFSSVYGFFVSWNAKSNTVITPDTFDPDFLGVIYIFLITLGIGCLVALNWALIGRLTPSRASTQFYALDNEIGNVLHRILNDNTPPPKKVADLHMSGHTVAHVKPLIYKLNKLKIPSPGIRNIPEWIDWLPLLKVLAEDKDIKEARKTDPYKRTLNKLCSENERNKGIN